MDTDSAYLALGSGKRLTERGVEEITGGCFCCRLDELVAAIGRLDAGARPDVIVAEPVGSCTDLVGATCNRSLASLFAWTPSLPLCGPRHFN